MKQTPSQSASIHHSAVFHVDELADQAGHLGGGDTAVGAVGVAGSDDGPASDTLHELGFGDLFGGVAADACPASWPRTPANSPSLGN